MQDYNTIMGVIQMRLVGCSYDIVQRRHNVGSGTVTLIMNRFRESGLSYDQLKSMEPVKVQELIYPPVNLRRKVIPEPDFQHYYDKIHAKDSKANVSFCWFEYRKKHPDGYSASQFYERYNQFVEKNYGAQDAKMAVERVPGERMYIDWVGDQPELLTDPETGEILKVHIFTTTLGLCNLIYAEIFMDEKMPQFIQGTVNAIRSYGGVAKYLVPDNLRTAIKKHTKDELILQSAFSDLEDFYGTIVLPPPAYKPKGYRKKSIIGNPSLKPVKYYRFQAGNMKWFSDNISAKAAEMEQIVFFALPFLLRNGYGITGLILFRKRFLIDRAKGCSHCVIVSMCIDCSRIER